MTKANRSVWKLPYIHPIFFSENFLKSKSFVTKISMTTIAKKFRRKFLYVYNGRIFRKRYIRRVTLGNKLGAFIRTKVFGRYVLESLMLKVKKKRLEKKKK